MPSPTSFMAAHPPASASPDSPEALTDAARRGDVAAFARIIRLHHEAMTRIALLVTGERRTAVQAVADAWPTAWRRLGGLEDPSRLAAWLGAIAADQAVFLVRHRSARATRPSAVDVAMPDFELARRLAALRPEDRALLARHHLAGQEVAEIARGVLWSARRTRARLARLTTAVAGPLPTGAGPEAVAAQGGARLRAHVDVPVLPVLVDDAARAARDGASFERVRMVSVAVSALIGLVVATAPYLVRLAHGR